MGFYSIPKQTQALPFSSPQINTKSKPLRMTFRTKTDGSFSSFKYKRDEWTPSSPSVVTPKSRRNRKTSRKLVTISTSSDGKWSGKWTSDHVFSLEELRLADLAEDVHTDAQVFINLTIEKHASFGFSVHGRITASFASLCINCSSSYDREINTTFDVWVLPSGRDNSSDQLPHIGGDDPSLSSHSPTSSNLHIHTRNLPIVINTCKVLLLQVIYVKPGCEADLDSLIKDTIRLTTSVKETCSETCEKSEQRWQCTTKEASPSVDSRWSTLLKLRNKSL